MLTSLQRVSHPLEALWLFPTTLIATEAALSATVESEDCRSWLHVTV